MSDQLQALRKQLDEINLKLLDLLSERAQIAKQIGEVKKKQGINKFDPEREKNMLNTLVKQNPGPFSDDTIRYLFKQIFKACLDLQQDNQKKELLASRKKRTDTVLDFGGVTVGGLQTASDRRTLFRGVGGTGFCRGQSFERTGRQVDAGRRFQTPDIALRLPGIG